MYGVGQTMTKRGFADAGRSTMNYANIEKMTSEKIHCQRAIGSFYQLLLLTLLRIQLGFLRCGNTAITYAVLSFNRNKLNMETALKAFDNNHMFWNERQRI